MNEEKNLIIVYNKETEKYANFLKALLTQDDDTEEKIIGVKDGTVDVVVHSYNEYRQNKMSMGKDNYILFIGNDGNIKNETEFIKIKGEYGLKYGWVGKIGVLFVDKNKLEKREYQKLFEKLKKYGDYIKQNKEVFLLDKNKETIMTTVGVASLFLFLFPLLLPPVLLIPWNVYKINNYNKILKQQYLCLVLTFYFELINQFIGE